MAVSEIELQVTWPTAANSKSVASAGNETSEAITFAAGVIAANLQIKADNAGTPASGDTINFYWLPSLGDPDGASTEEYTTSEHGIPIPVLDTNKEDPAITVCKLPAPFYKGKLYAVNNSSGRAQTVSATILQQVVT